MHVTTKFHWSHIPESIMNRAQTTYFFNEVKFNLSNLDIRRILTVFEYFKNREEWFAVEIEMDGEVQFPENYNVDYLEWPKIRVTNYDMVYIVMTCKHDRDSQLIITLEEKHYEESSDHLL